MITKTRYDKDGREYTFKSEIDPDACFECGRKDAGVEEHHPVPKSLGGTRVIPLCPECHTLIHYGEKKRRETVSKLTTEALIEVRKNKALGRPDMCEYGYRNVDGKKVPHEEEQQWLTRIFEIRNELRQKFNKPNRSFGRLVHERIVEEGMLTRKGEAPHEQNVYRVFKSKKYNEDTGLWESIPKHLWTKKRKQEGESQQ